MSNHMFIFPISRAVTFDKTKLSLLLMKISFFFSIPLSIFMRYISHEKVSELDIIIMSE